MVGEASTLGGGQDGKTESKANLGYTQLRIDCKTLSLPIKASFEFN